MSLKSFRGVSTIIRVLIQALMWMKATKVARSRTLLFSDAVIVNWLQKRQILITYMTFAIRRAQSMVPGTWIWAPRLGLPPKTI